MEREINVDKFIDQVELIHCLRKRWKLIVVVIVALMLSVFAVNKFASKDLLYQSKTTIFVGKEEVSDKSVVYQNSDVLMYQSLVRSYEYIYKTSDLIEEAIGNTIDRTVSNIKKNLKVTPMEDTQIIEVIYNDENPNVAKEVLDLINKKFVEKVNLLVPNSKVDVIEHPKTPIGAINSKNRIPYIIAILFAIPLALGVAIAVERWNDYILTEDELEGLVGRPILTIIPKIDMKKVK